MNTPMLSQLEEARAPWNWPEIEDEEKEEEEDAEFADKPWYTACCKDCKYRRLIIEGKQTYCLMLYVAGEESMNCGLIKKWEETRK